MFPIEGDSCYGDDYMDAASEEVATYAKHDKDFGLPSSTLPKQQNLG